MRYEVEQAQKSLSVPCGNSFLEHIVFTIASFAWDIHGIHRPRTDQMKLPTSEKGSSRIQTDNEPYGEMTAFHHLAQISAPEPRCEVSVGIGI